MKKVFTIAALLASASCMWAQQTVYFFNSDSSTPFANYEDVQRIEFGETGVSIVQNDASGVTVAYEDFTYFGFNESSSIDDVNIDGEAGSLTIYNTMGVYVGSDLDQLPTGIYIVRDEQTKTAKKIFKK